MESDEADRYPYRMVASCHGVQLVGIRSTGGDAATNEFWPRLKRIGRQHLALNRQQDHGVHFISGTLSQSQNIGADTFFVSVVFVFLWLVRFMVHSAAKILSHLS
jgi:hypothetical protein